MEYGHIGEAIRHHRGTLGITQEELAKRAKMAPTSIVRLENGEIRKPRMSTIDKLAGALQIPVVELARFVSSIDIARPLQAVSEGVGPFTAVYQRDGEWWIGFVEELPGANGQGESLQEARESLREAVSLVLEANREITRTEFEDGDVVREPLSV